MPFDASTAEPVAAQSGFDPTSAEPVEQPSGFDPESAQPLKAPSSTPEEGRKLRGMTDEDVAFLREESGQTGSFQQKRLEPALAGAMAPAVKIPDVPDMGPGYQAQIVRGVLQGAKSIPEALTAPVMTVLAPLGAVEAVSPIATAISKAAQTYFAGDMAAAGGRKAAETVDILHDPTKTLAEKTAAVTETAADLGMAGLISLHATKVKKEAAIPAVGEGENERALDNRNRYTQLGPPDLGQFSPETAEPLARKTAGETDVSPATRERLKLNQRLANDTFDPETARPIKPENPVEDFNRYQQIHQEMSAAIKAGEVDTPAFKALWQENEDIKNRNSSDPGMPPEEPPPVVTQAGQGELLGAETPFNLAGEQVPNGEAPPEVPPPETAELLPPSEGRATAPTELDQRNEVARNEAKAEIESQRKYDLAEEFRKNREKLGLPPAKPLEYLPEIIARLGRERVNELVGDWNSDAELSDDGKRIVQVDDPRSYTGKARASSKEFMSWMAGHPDGQIGGLDLEGETIEPTAKPLTPAERAAMRTQEGVLGKPDTGPELLDWIKGKLPRPEDESALGGELQRIYDNLVKETKVAERKANIKQKGRAAYTQKNTLEANNFFSKPGVKADLDRLRQAANEAGFNFETPADMLGAVEDSMRGQKLYANPTEEGVGSPIKITQHTNETNFENMVAPPEPAPKPTEGPILGAMKTRADAARERLKAKLGRASAGIDPSDLRDMAEIGAYHLARGIVGAAEWGAEMVKEFGEKVRPHLTLLRQMAERVHGDQDKGAAETYGIAARVTAQRAEGGHIEAVEPGVVSEPEAIVERGRQLLEAGNDPDAVLAKALQNREFSANTFAILRARGEELARTAKDAMESFGVGSPEYDAAAKADSDWTAAIKPLQTEWAEAGRAQQGETEIDTGTFHGLRRAFQEDTGKDFTPEQAGQAIKVAEKVKKAADEVDATKARVLRGIDEQTSMLPQSEPSPEVASLASRISERMGQAADDALARIKDRLRSGKAFSGIDPEYLSDYIIYGSAKIAKGALDFGTWSAEMVKDIGHQIEPYLKEIWEKANTELDRQVEKAVKQPERRRAVKDAVKKAGKAKKSLTKIPALEKVEPLAEEARKQEPLPGFPRESVESDNALRKGGTILGNAEEQARQAGLEGIEKPAVIPDEATRRTGEIKGNAEEQAKQAGLEGVEKPAVRPDNPTSRKGAVVGDAREQAKQMRINTTQAGPGAEDVWALAKQYVTEGNTDYEEMRSKIASDLGLPISEVTRILSQPEKLRVATNEMYEKMSALRGAREDAKNFLKEAATPGWMRFIRNVPRAFFAAKVFGHGTVGMITHAGLNIFDPGAWRTYWPNFFRQFRLLGWHDKGAFHERMMQDLVRDENFTTARRAGLANDPRNYADDYQSTWLGTYFKRIGLTGNRGFDALKLFRQARFNQIWNDLPDSLKTRDMAKLVADEVNHATGVVRMKFRDWANWTWFAPKLEGSRWAWLIGDPAKAAKTIADWKNATSEEKAHALREVRQKAIITGVYLSALATNQGLLSMVGSKQQINFSNPRRSDFLEFKAGDYKFGVVGPMLGIVRLFANLMHAAFGHRSNVESLTPRAEQFGQEGASYLRGKLSPFASFGVDLLAQSDYAGRPLPFSKDKVPAYLRKQGVGPYTYGEYAAQQLSPIPVAEAVKEIWAKQGMSETEIEHWMKGLAAAVVMGGTGARMSKDTHIGEPINPPKGPPPASLHRRH